MTIDMTIVFYACVYFLQLCLLSVNVTCFFIFQNAFPARYKGFHYYNMSPIFEGILTLIKPIMSKKWTDRVSSIECMILIVNNFYYNCKIMEVIKIYFSVDSIEINNDYMRNQFAVLQNFN